MSLRDQLRGAAQAFQEVTGMSCIDFELLLVAQHELLQRQSVLKFDESERLLMVLIYSHLNATYSLLGELFSCHPSTVKRIVTPLLGALPVPENHAPTARCDKAAFILRCPQAALILGLVVPLQELDSSSMPESKPSPPIHSPELNERSLLVGADSSQATEHAHGVYDLRNTNNIAAVIRFQLDAIMPVRLASVYLIVFSLVEAITLLLHAAVGYVLYHVLVVIVIYSAVLTGDERRRRFTISLSLPPIMRIISLGVPLADFPTVMPYVFTGFMMLLATHIARKNTGYDLEACGMHITTKLWGWQIIVLALGGVIGAAGYLILRPEPLILALNWQPLVVPSLAILFFSGFAEEFTYHGLIQRAAVDLFDARGIFFVALVFTIMHVALFSLPFLLLTFTTSLIFGWIVLRTDTILGVALAHGLINLIMLLYLPNVLL